MHMHAQALGNVDDSIMKAFIIYFIVSASYYNILTTIKRPNRTLLRLIVRYIR